MPAGKPRRCLDLHLVRGEDDRVEVRPLSGRAPGPVHALAPLVTLVDLQRFTRAVAAAAARGEALDAAAMALSMQLHDALFRGGAHLAAGEPTLVRIFTSDPDLGNVPWEALARPGEDRAFAGSSADVFVTRGVTSRETWATWPVRGAVAVLVVAPQGGYAHLEAALGQRDDVLWLPPVVGDRARNRYLLDSLPADQDLHVLHYVGHGGVRDGSAVLELGGPGQPEILHVAQLAQNLEPRFRGSLRLVILECCEGGRAGQFGSAAETLGRGGADAVVAHLWPVDGGVARDVSQALYESLGRGGDAAVALNDARRRVLAAHAGSAAAFSPILYLRTPSAQLFEFAAKRDLSRPSDAPVEAAAAPRELTRLLARAKGFSLLLGDDRDDHLPRAELLRGRLEARLARPVPAGSPLSAVAQRFLLEHGEKELFSELHAVFGDDAPRSPLVDALAARVGRGVHVTLLRLPLLEEAIAERRPGETIHVIRPPHPGESSFTLLTREAGAPTQAWRKQELEAADLDADQVDPDEAIVVLRLYQGYLPPEHEAQRALRPPLITEDDYLLGVPELRAVGSPDLADAVEAALTQRPMLLVGFSAMAWHHRILLHRLLGTSQVPKHSVVVLGADEAERKAWKSGTCLPGKAGVDVVEASDGDLLRWLAAAPGRTP